MLRVEVRRVLKLAVPVALGELGWMGMTTVDTIMIGPLGPAAIGAIGIGSNAFYSFAVFGMGLLFGLDTLVSQAFGAGKLEECRRWLRQGLFLATFLSIPLTCLFWFAAPVFRYLGIDAEVSRLAGEFLRTLAFSTLPLLWYGAFRRYLQGMGRVRPVMAALISANLVNWLFNWLLIYGHAGLPALGVSGSALSTCLARVYMAAYLGIAVWSVNRKQPNRESHVSLHDMMRILKIGLPAATQIILEIGAFGAVGILAGRLTPVALAAHQIALNCAALSFMIPLGTSSAAAVAVGHAVGRGEPEVARRAGFIAMGLACAFMLVSAVLFLTIPRQILQIYSSDPGVLATGATLLALAAAFQLFDGLQTVATGALRGTGQTRLPMWANLFGYWFFGLPAGYFFCFALGWGVYGLWCGLTMALIVIATVLFFAWNTRSRRITHLPVIV